MFIGAVLLAHVKDFLIKGMWQIMEAEQNAMTFNTDLLNEQIMV